MGLDLAEISKRFDEALTDESIAQYFAEKELERIGLINFYEVNEFNTIYNYLIDRLLTAKLIDKDISIPEYDFYDVGVININRFKNCLIEYSKEKIGQGIKVTKLEYKSLIIELYGDVYWYDLNVLELREEKINNLLNE